MTHQQRGGRLRSGVVLGLPHKISGRRLSWFRGASAATSQKTSSQGDEDGDDLAKAGCQNCGL